MFVLSSQGLANIKSAERLKGRADAAAWLVVRPRSVDEELAHCLFGVHSRDVFQAKDLKLAGWMRRLIKLNDEG